MAPGTSHTRSPARICTISLTPSPSPPRATAAAPALPAIREEAEDAKRSGSPAVPRSKQASGAIGGEGASSGQMKSFTLVVSKGAEKPSSGGGKPEKLKSIPAPAKPPANSVAQPRQSLLGTSSDYISPTAFLADVARQTKKDKFAIREARTCKEDRAQASCAEPGCEWRIVAVPKDGRWAVAPELSSTRHTHGATQDSRNTKPSVEKAQTKVPKESGAGNAEKGGKAEVQSGVHVRTRSKTINEHVELVVKQPAPKDNDWSLATRSKALEGLIEARSFVFANQRSYYDLTLIGESQSLIASYMESEKAQATGHSRNLTAALYAWKAFCSHVAVDIPAFPITPSVLALFAVQCTILKTAVPTQHIQALDELRRATAGIWRRKLGLKHETALTDLPALKDFFDEYSVTFEESGGRAAPSAAPPAQSAAQATPPSPRTSTSAHKEPPSQGFVSFSQLVAPRSKAQPSPPSKHPSPVKIKMEAHPKRGNAQGEPSSTLLSPRKTIVNDSKATTSKDSNRRELQPFPTNPRPTFFGALPPANVAKPPILPPQLPKPSNSKDKALSPRQAKPCSALSPQTDVKPVVPSKRSFDIVISDGEEEQDKKPAITPRIPSPVSTLSNARTPPAPTLKKPKPLPAAPPPNSASASTTDDLRCFLNTLIDGDPTFGDTFAHVFEEIGARYPAVLLRWAGDEQKMVTLMKLLEGKVPPLLFEELSEGLLREVKRIRMVG